MEILVKCIGNMMLMATLAVGGILPLGGGAGEVAWEDPSVNSIGRLPARTYSMPLADESDALSDDLEPRTPFRKLLNGSWRFWWAGSPELQEHEFWKVDYVDDEWFEVDVPCCVETRGFGSPGYTNQRYPHADLSHPTNELFACIRDRVDARSRYNPVLSYRRRFVLPDEWKGRRTILRFDGVYSAFYVWVNGVFVGYAEDSALPSEFDITESVKPGSNLIAVKVHRWCDGSYLEDQDMFRFSGIFRDVSIWSMPENGIWDFVVKTEVSADYRSARLSIEGCDFDKAKLYDSSRNLVCVIGRTGEWVDVDNVRLWSAEDPYLYTLVLRRGEDVRAKRIGFKEQKVDGNVFRVNGQPIKFKGVNRHEVDVENGRTVSLESMIADIRLMKRYNVDTVRTSHYPNHHSWYDLCDKYGIYLVAEANVEGHEPRFGANGLGRFPEWEHSIVERNVRHAIFYRNNVSVTMWSVGNETGHGDCFRRALAEVRKTDPSRPLHWERGNRDADVDSRMYPSVEWLERRGRLGMGLEDSMPIRYAGDCDDHTKGKCAFLCEYAHAMGNALGSFDHYWEIFYKYPSLCGGCVWDWVDQAVWRRTGRMDDVTGCEERYLAYGGDFDEQPNDGPFCVNGLVDPFRTVTPKLIEVGHVHRNLVVKKDEDGRYCLENRFLFTNANRYDGEWELYENGLATARGSFEVPSVPPLSSGVLELPVGCVDTNKDVLLNVTFKSKAKTCWTEAGWVVSRNQIVLGRDDVAKRFGDAEPVRPRVLSDTKDCLTIQYAGTKITFSRITGTVSELILNGKTVMRDQGPGLASGPRFSCSRAFVDNDVGIRDDYYASGLSQMQYHPYRVLLTNDSVVTESVITGSKSAGFTQKAEWRFLNDGSVEVDFHVVPHGRMPAFLPRAGMSMRLDPSLEGMEYYGRGPYENYVDRQSASFLGVWKSTVTDQFVSYVRPQDCGYKCDVKWARFVDSAGCGVEFMADRPLFMQALHYAHEDLEFARHRRGQQRFYNKLRPARVVYLNLDIGQHGLGGHSCGPEPEEGYSLRPGVFKWKLRIRGVGMNSAQTGSIPVWYRSSTDMALQPMWVYCPSNRTDRPYPLLVGFHSWSMNWQSPERQMLERFCEERGWLLAYPNFRGPNESPDACGSMMAGADVLDAIDTMKRCYKVDESRIYAIGGSGGGHFSLLMAGRYPELWAGVCAMCPISDLALWYKQCDELGDWRNRYARMLERTCGGRPENRNAEYALRSPISCLKAARDVPIAIHEGIHDGHIGSVPVGHAIRAFNELALDADQIDEDAISYIENAESIPKHLRISEVADPFFDERHKVHFRRISGNASLTLFEGGHGGNFAAGIDFLSRQRKGHPADWTLPDMAKGEVRDVTK